ncbi:MAG TPA: hypothetical protein VF743_10370 [Acidimicrobiales bacterium]
MGRTWSGIRGALRGLGAAGARTTGYPTSSNRASSLHLAWELPPGTGPVVAASVVLVVEAEPPVPDLYFWALQVNFADGGGRRHGGAHLGLQWHRPHPGSRAANWGGYAPGRGELAGSGSPLPSATGNPNTRDLWWEPGRPHTLAVERAPEGGWAGSVDGVRLRALHAGGDRLEGLMVWSEVFARCDAPPVAVRWSGFRVVTADGGVAGPSALRVNYQRRADGGCDNTTALPDGDGVRQVTGTDRVTPQGARLPLC